MNKNLFQKTKRAFLYGIVWGLGVVLSLSAAYVVYAYSFVNPGTVNDPTFGPEDGNVKLPEGACKRYVYQAGDVSCTDANYYVIAVQDTSGNTVNPTGPPVNGYIICCRIAQ